MAVARLGDYAFRIDPKEISYQWNIDQTTIDTIGGQVIQVTGATIGDITVTCDFGQDRTNQRLSWELAENFATIVKSMMDQQTMIAGEAVHNPISFTYQDGVHDWDFKVLIKAVSDANGQGSVHHTNGTFSYGVTLTLFPVADSAGILSQVATDVFIASIANGVGWKKNAFNGQDTLDQAIEFIKGASPSNPTLNGYLTKLLETAAGVGG